MVGRGEVVQIVGAAKPPIGVRTRGLGGGVRVGRGRILIDHRRHRKRERLVINQLVR